MFLETKEKNRQKEIKNKEKDFNIKINQKRFEGKIYNDYEIKYENLEEFDFDKENIYYKKNIYEAYIYKQQPIENIMNKIRKDKVKIAKLL